MASQLPNIDAALSRFVAHPRQLRKIMLSTSALISGSFAIQFFLSTTYPNSDLDIYVPCDDISFSNPVAASTSAPTRSWSKAQTLISHLEKLENYDLASTTSIYAGMKDIETVMTFYGPPFHSKGMGSPMVQVVLLKRGVVENVLESFYGTHILNFISGVGAYCLFPGDLKEKKVRLTRDPGTYREVLGGKYVGRGFGVEEIEIAEGWAAGERVRWIGDEETWTVGFGDGDSDGEVVDDGVIGRRFEVGMQDFGQDGEEGRKCLRIKHLG